MACRTKILSPVRDILLQRSFTEVQIEKVLPKLHKGYFDNPKYLGEIIDTWNTIMKSSNPEDERSPDDAIPPPAVAPKNSWLGMHNVTMNTILADIEPDLLLFEPNKLRYRHEKVVGLAITNKQSELWTLLYNAPRGFYLQDYIDLAKKVYYIEHRVIDLLYDKKERKAMLTHPLVKSAAVTEVNYDHIRTRYLFALRSGYNALSHLYEVQTALDRPTLTDLVLSKDALFLKKFTPYCSLEEYRAFADLMSNHELDEDDSEVFEKMAELHALSHN